MVSIIIPTYNRGYVLKRSIDSILNQTYKNFELIIVDDNSNDNTENIVKSIQDERIIYIKQEENLGANAARNRGIRESKGDFIAFQDSDDEWLHNKLELQLEELKQNNADIVYCSFNRFEGNNHWIIPENSIKSENTLKELLKGNFISTQTILARKECFENNLFDEALPRFQDWDLVIRLAMKYKIHHVNIPLVDVYLQKDSISKSNEKANKAISIMMNKYREYIIVDKQIHSIWYRLKMHYATTINDKTIYFKECIKEGLFGIKNLGSYIKSVILLYNKN